MSDVRGQARALTVLTRIERGRAGALRGVLERLPAGRASPLGRLPGTHFARWVLVPELDFGDFPPQGLPRDPAYLLFASTFEGSEDDHLAAICARMPRVADEVWGCCEGYPGSADPVSFAGYMRRHKIWTNLLVAAYPDAGLEDVVEALELRRRLGRFAVRAQGMAPDDLQAAFWEEF